MFFPIIDVCWNKKKTLKGLERKICKIDVNACITHNDKILHDEPSQIMFILVNNLNFMFVFSAQR